MMVLISFFSSLTKKDSVERARYEIGIQFFSTLTKFWDVFFTDPDFWPIRIRNTGLINVAEPPPPPFDCAGSGLKRFLVAVAVPSNRIFGRIGKLAK